MGVILSTGRRTRKYKKRQLRDRTPYIPHSEFRIMKIPLDKSYIKPTRVDETGKIVGWHPEREAERLEYGLPKFILPKAVGAADAGLKWLWPGPDSEGAGDRKNFET